MVVQKCKMLLIHLASVKIKLQVVRRIRLIHSFEISTQYSSVSVYMFVCLSVCQSIFASAFCTVMKNVFIYEHEIKYVAVYETSLDNFDLGHCQIKVKVTVGLQ